MRIQKEVIWKFTKKKREVKRGIYKSKKKANEQFGRKMNQYVSGNRKFWKEVSKVNGGELQQNKD